MLTTLCHSVIHGAADEKTSNIWCRLFRADLHNSAGSSFAKNQSLSVVAGRCATILQPPSIIAGLPSAVAWSHPKAEGVPTSRPVRRPIKQYCEYSGGGVKIE